MNKTQALRVLRKQLGKDFGYREDYNALLSEERAKARTAYLLARTNRDTAQAAAHARRVELLDNDEEYQRLARKAASIGRQCEQLRRAHIARRITVGLSHSLFFEVKAEGDNWLEVVDKINAAQKATP